MYLLVAHYNSKLPDALLSRIFFYASLLYQKFYRNERPDLVLPKFFNLAGYFLDKVAMFYRPNKQEIAKLDE